MDPMERLHLLETAIRENGVTPEDVIMGVAVLRLSGSAIVSCVLDGDARILLSKRVAYLVAVGVSADEIMRRAGLTAEGLGELLAEILPVERRRLRALEVTLRATRKSEAARASPSREQTSELNLTPARQGDALA